MNLMLNRVGLRIIAVILVCAFAVFTVLCGLCIIENIDHENVNYFSDSYLATSIAGNVADEVYWAMYHNESLWLESIGDRNEILIITADGETLIDTHDEESRIVIDGWPFEFIRDDNTECVYTLSIFIPQEINADSPYYFNYQLFDFIKSVKDIVIPLFIISAVITLVLLIFLLWSAGHTKDGIELKRLDKIPLDIVLAAAIATAAFLSFLIFQTELVTANPTNYLWLIDCCLICAIMYAIALVCVLTLMTISARLKAGKWWENTIIYIAGCYVVRAVAKIFKIIRNSFSTIAMARRVSFAFIAFLILNGILWLSAGIGESYAAIILAMVLNSAALLLFFKVIRDADKIRKFSNTLASGQFDENIDTENMLPDFAKVADNLNSTQKGLSLAVNDKLKSEKFKTELITNVSHDLKTPLTSIINYVDLLSKEKIDNSSAEEYIEILQRQSNKLKKLTVDLVDAAKASSGAIAVNFETVNVNELLEQSIGEYSEKLELAGLNTVISADSSCNITADGRLLSRVLDNLINNVIKYALTGTRVYFNVIEANEKVHIFIKNISREPLNISADELMERFVRGDTSRSTEGSGLGLSIAKSLTELMHGTFDLTLDGDLFKIELSFPKT